MNEADADMKLKSRVIKTMDVAWKQFAYIQQDDLKQWAHDAKGKLKASIISNDFAQPFYVWQDPSDSVIYCLDGRHRTLILEELELEGYSIPDKLPAILIDCNDKQHAAKLVLIYSSLYARVTDRGLFDFLEKYELDAMELAGEMDLPDFDMKAFNGDLDTDFSLRNREIDVEEFTDEIILKFKYHKSEYLDIKKAIRDVQDLHSLDSPEAVIKFLLKL